VRWRFVSRRNRILGLPFAALGIVLVFSASVTTSDPAAAVIELLIAIECIYFGLRLFVSSVITISQGQVRYRTRSFRIKIVRASDIAEASEGHRLLAYERVFPRIALKNGKYVDLISFELKQSKALETGNSVSKIVERINDQVRYLKTY
jgi:hypothetical protein